MNIKKIKWSESAGKITINYEKIEQSDDNANDGSYFNKDTVYKIKKIIEEAIIFINGNRAQMKLFEQEKEDDAILEASISE